ncbi:MAG: hypothetical protein ACKV2T_19840 [Kofleriaceae bacterium]
MATSLFALGESVAYASSCSGDSDSSSGSSSFDDSSSDSSPEPAPPCEGPCADYAVWRARNAPVLTLDVGVATRSFASPLGAQTGSVTHDMQSFSYRVVGPAGQPSAPLENAVVGQLRVGAPLRHGFYLAGELEIGALTSPTVAAEMTSSGELGTPTLTATSTTVAGGVGVIGFEARLGRVDLGVEVAGGGRALFHNYDSTYLACETTSTIAAGSAVLEGRARAKFWISPYVTLSAVAGKSALDEGMMGGFTVGFTNHAFGIR